MIEFRNVALHYHYDDYAVLKELNFTLINGVNTILCDTQSGKSSICKLLTKQFKPTNGQIFVDNTNIESITNQGLGILYMPSEPVFFERRSVKYNILYPLKIRKLAKDDQLKRLDYVKSKVGLGNVDVKAKSLTSDERRRVAIARGLTVNRKVVLLDDFCNDSAQIDEAIRLFNGSAIVFLTSDVSLVRGNVIVLDGGISVYQGNAEGAIEIRKNLSWIVDILRSE